MFGCVCMGGGGEVQGEMCSEEATRGLVSISILFQRKKQVRSSGVSVEERRCLPDPGLRLSVPTLPRCFWLPPACSLGPHQQLEPPRRGAWGGKRENLLRRLGRSSQ